MKILIDTIQNIALEIRTGKTPPTSNPEYFGDEVNWYTPSDLDKEKYLGKSRRGITEKALADKKAIVFKQNTVLIGAIGDVGKLGITSNLSSSNQQITGIYPDPKKIDAQYLYYWLKANKQILIGKSKSAIVPILNNKDLGKVKFSYPENIPDQLHITNILSKAENLIAHRKESIRLLDEFLKSTFLEMFGNNTLDDKEWNKISLIEGCVNKKDVKCGPFGTQLSKSEYQGNGIPVWGIPQINSEFKILPKDFVTEGKALELDEYSVIPYDIVMSRKGNVGKCSLFPKGFPKGIIHSDVLRIRTDIKKVHPVFLLFQLKYSKKIEIQIKGVTKGAIMAGINVGLLKHITIDQPPIELQTQFAQIVEKTEALKTQYQQSLQELENLYGSLSQRAFRGESTSNKAVSV